MPGRHGAGPPTEVTTEEPMIIVDSVASEPITNCHLGEKFVSQNVVWGSEVTD